MIELKAICPLQKLGKTLTWEEGKQVAVHLVLLLSTASHLLLLL